MVMSTKTHRFTGAANVNGHRERCAPCGFLSRWRKWGGGESVEVMIDLLPLVPLMERRDPLLQ